MLSIEIALCDVAEVLGFLGIMLALPGLALTGPRHSMVRYAARREIDQAWQDGHRVGSRNVPPTCGAYRHDPSDFWYDPGC